MKQAPMDGSHPWAPVPREALRCVPREFLARFPGGDS